VESSADEPLRYVHGTGELLDGLERELEGREPGERIVVRLGPDEGFGEFDPALIDSIPRDQLPAELELVAGERLIVSVEGGGEEEELEVRILEVDADAVVVDVNHPLAGQSVTFELEVRSVSGPEPGP